MKEWLSELSFVMREFDSFATMRARLMGMLYIFASVLFVFGTAYLLTGLCTHAPFPNMISSGTIAGYEWKYDLGPTPVWVGMFIAYFLALVCAIAGHRMYKTIEKKKRDQPPDDLQP